MLLQDFSCKVIHVTGKRNVEAEVLSRYSLVEASTSPKLDYYILVLEGLNYEPLLRYIYTYISTLSFDEIPEDM